MTFSSFDVGQMTFIYLDIRWSVIMKLKDRRGGEMERAFLEPDTYHLCLQATEQDSSSPE